MRKRLLDSDNHRRAGRCQVLAQQRDNATSRKPSLAIEGAPGHDYGISVLGDPFATDVQQTRQFERADAARHGLRKRAPFTECRHELIEQRLPFELGYLPFGSCLSTRCNSRSLIILACLLCIP